MKRTLELGLHQVSLVDAVLSVTVCGAISEAEAITLMDFILVCDRELGNLTMLIYATADFSVTPEARRYLVKSSRTDRPAIPVAVVGTGVLARAILTLLINAIRITTRMYVPIRFFQTDQDAGYDKVMISAGANLQAEARKYARGNKNTLVVVDKSFANSFGNLARLKSSMFKTSTNTVFVIADALPTQWSVEAVHEINEQKMANVVGILPGKSKKEEYVP